MRKHEGDTGRRGQVEKEKRRKGNQEKNRREQNEKKKTTWKKRNAGKESKRVVQMRIEKGRSKQGEGKLNRIMRKS